MIPGRCPDPARPAYGENWRRTIRTGSRAAAWNLRRVQAGDASPVLAAGGGVVNGASLQPEAPVAPGSVVSILGQNLAYGKAESPGMPLETQLAGSLVTIGGKVAPLMMAAEGRINALVPLGLAVNARHQLMVRRGGSYSPAGAVTIGLLRIRPYSPRRTARVRGLVYRPDASWPKPRRAKTGDHAGYCTGQGETHRPCAVGRSGAGVARSARERGEC